MADQNTVSRIGGLLKTVYGPAKVWEILNLVTTARKRYLKKSDEVPGPGNTTNLAINLTDGRGAIAPSFSDDPLPSPVQQDNEQWAVSERGYTGQVQFYDRDLEVASNNKQAFVPYLEDTITRFLKAAAKVTNIDFVAGDGSGILGLVNAAVNNSNSVPLQIGTNFGQFGSRYLLDAGDKIDFFDPTLTTSRTAGAGVVVNSVARSVGGSVPTITVSANVTLQANDIMVRWANGAANKAYVGLFEACNNDATVFQGKSRATYPALRGQRISANGNTLNQGYLEQLQDAIVSAGGQLDEYLVGQAQFKAYLDLCYAQKRFMTTSLDAGFKKADSAFGGAPIIEDIDVPSQVVYGIERESIDFMVVTPLSWMDRDGEILRRVPGYAAYSAVLREYANPYYKTPNHLGMITELAYSSGVPYTK
jgi:hypothetical protein